MIKLTNPLLLNGRIIPCDKVVGLDSEFEQKIVNAGNAIFMNEDLKEEVPEPVSKEDHQLEDEEEVPEPVSEEDHQLEDNNTPLDLESIAQETLNIGR